MPEPDDLSAVGALNLGLTFQPERAIQLKGDHLPMGEVLKTPECPQSCVPGTHQKLPDSLPNDFL
jgi:hypothetical protein